MSWFVMPAYISEVAHISLIYLSIIIVVMFVLFSADIPVDILMFQFLHSIDQSLFELSRFQIFLYYIL